MLGVCDILNCFESQAQKYYNYLVYCYCPLFRFLCHTLSNSYWTEWSTIIGRDTPDLR